MNSKILDLKQMMDFLQTIVEKHTYNDAPTLEQVYNSYELLYNRVKELDETLTLSLYIMSGASSQLDLTIPREKANYTELNKGIKLIWEVIRANNENS